MLLLLKIAALAVTLLTILDVLYWAWIEHRATLPLLLTPDLQHLLKIREGRWWQSVADALDGYHIFVRRFRHPVALCVELLILSLLPTLMAMILAQNRIERISAVVLYWLMWLVHCTGCFLSNHFRLKYVLKLTEKPQI